MTIHRKILLLLLLSVSLYTVLGIGFQRLLILPSFRSLEATEARTNMQRCHEALEREIEHLATFCSDWSVWDDTYDFIQSQTEDYIASNLGPASFIENNLNLMYFYDLRGNLVWGSFYDLETEAPTAFTDFPATGWAATHKLLNPGPRNYNISGVIQTSKGPMLLAACAILPSESTEGETILGTMLMGKLLGDSLIESIRNQSQVDLEVFPFGDPSLPKIVQALPPGDLRLLYESNDYLRTFMTLADIDSVPALTFATRMSRDILAQGQAAIRLQTIAAAIAGLLFAALLGIFLKGLISTPLNQLRAQVRAIHSAPNESKHSSPASRDEIDLLARDFDNMLRRLRRVESERALAENALRISEERLQTILKTAPDAIVVTDRRGCIESANDAAAALFGYSAAELIGLRGRVLLPEEEQAYWVDAVADAAKSTDPTPFTANRESAIRDRSGNIHPVHMSVSSMILDGEIHFTSSVRDITSLKKLQADMARARHLATIGEMGATVAHEIRNPLTGMRGVLRLMRDSDLRPDQQQEALDGLTESVDRIAHTVDQLLRYARPMVPKVSPFPLRPLIDAVCGLPVNGRPTPDHVQVTCSEELEIKADPNLLRQVLENIWSNACYAISTDGHLTWTVDDLEDQIRITLCDDGHGISEAVQDHLFEPFVTTRIEGTGLGLAVSLRIVEAHRGTITLERNDGVGSLVTITLPKGV